HGGTLPTLSKLAESNQRIPQNRFCASGRAAGTPSIRKTPASCTLRASPHVGKLSVLIKKLNTRTMGVPEAAGQPSSRQRERRERKMISITYAIIAVCYIVLAIDAFMN